MKSTFILSTAAADQLPLIPEPLAPETQTSEPLIMGSYMKNVLLIFFIFILAAAAGCKKPPENEGCTDSGGTIERIDCCSSVQDDFPNTCLEGVCTCGPGNTRKIYSCICSTGQCFDGTACVEYEDETGTNDAD